MGAIVRRGKGATERLAAAQTMDVCHSVYPDPAGRQVGSGLAVRRDRPLDPTCSAIETKPPGPELATLDALTRYH